MSCLMIFQLQISRILSFNIFSCACYFHLRWLFGKHDDEEVTVFALCAEHRGLCADFAPVTNIVMNIVTNVVTMSRTCNAQWRPQSGWRDGEKWHCCGQCLYSLRACREKRESKVKSYDVIVLEYYFTSQKLQWRDYWTE